MIDIEFLQRMREILDKIEFLSEPIDEDVDSLFDEAREMIGEKEIEIVLREIRADEENDRGPVTEDRSGRRTAVGGR